jgi:hypothetical protein
MIYSQDTPDTNPKMRLDKEGYESGKHADRISYCSGL